MAESVIKSPAFLFSAAIWSYLVLSWPGLSYVWKAKYKTIGHVYMHYNYFSITATSSFLKKFVFCVYSIRLGYYMHLSKFTWI